MSTGARSAPPTGHICWRREAWLTAVPGLVNALCDGATRIVPRVEATR